MSQPKILVETAPPVTTIIINRPQVKNALDNEAARALAAAMRAFEVDADARVAGHESRGLSNDLNQDARNF